MCVNLDFASTPFSLFNWCWADDFHRALSSEEERFKGWSGNMSNNMMLVGMVNITN